MNTSEYTNNDGQVKCPKCGATDISVAPKTGRLRCNYCRNEFDRPSVNRDTEDDVFALTEDTVFPGMADIDPDASDLVVLKCPTCGSEVIIDTSESTQARCHWCRSTLSVNSQVANGAVPDMLLPFSVSKDEALGIIRGYIHKRRFFANKSFLREFSEKNLMAVFFPYAVVDIHANATFSGQAEVITKRHRYKNGCYYDVDRYNVSRAFEMGIDDLTIESSSERMNDQSAITNNIINTILPFDTENCKPFDSNYMRNVTAERRDMNMEDIRGHVEEQAKDIARASTRELTGQYDRGSRWTYEDLEIIGAKWKTAYLPVWLYSYYDSSKRKLHFTAVNGRTKEVSGSIPANTLRLGLMTGLIVLVSLVAAFVFWVVTEFEDPDILFCIALLPGLLFYFGKMSKLRSVNDRHRHEKETRIYMRNVTATDEFECHCSNQTTDDIPGRNDNAVNGTIIKARHDPYEDLKIVTDFIGLTK